MKIKNLTAYERETDAILEWCSNGWITSDEFDKLADSYEDELLRGPPRRMKAAGFAPDDYVLPSVLGNPSPNGDWIYMAQVLVDKGYLERRKVKGVVQYRRAAEAP